MFKDTIYVQQFILFIQMVSELRFIKFIYAIRKLLNLIIIVLLNLGALIFQINNNL